MPRLEPLHTFPLFHTHASAKKFGARVSSDEREHSLSRKRGQTSLGRLARTRAQHLVYARVRLKREPTCLMAPMQKPFEKIVWIVLDSVAIAALPDARDYVDGCDTTLAHLAESPPTA